MARLIEEGGDDMRWGGISRLGPPIGHLHASSPAHVPLQRYCRMASLTHHIESCLDILPWRGEEEAGGVGSEGVRESDEATVRTRRTTLSPSHSRGG